MEDMLAVGSERTDQVRRTSRQSLTEIGDMNTLTRNGLGPSPALPATGVVII